MRKKAGIESKCNYKYKKSRKGRKKKRKRLKQQKIVVRKLPPLDH